MGLVLARPLLNQLSVFRVNVLRLLGPALLFPTLLLLLGLVPELGEFGWHDVAALIASAVFGIDLIDARYRNAPRHARDWIGPGLHPGQSLGPGGGFLGE